MTTEQKPTSGNWRLTEGGIIDNDCATTDPSEYRELADVYGADIHDNRDLAPPYEEAMANGYLMAASKDLLAALEQLVKRCSDPDGVVVHSLEATRQGGFKSALIQEAEAAIKKGTQK